MQRDEAYEYLEAEDYYYDFAGINVYDLDNIQPSQMVSNTVIDQMDVDKYIVKETGLSAETVNKMSEVLHEYMEKNGFFA
ncbi:MAG: hypothetical protein J6I76_18900 [Oribacterium sp.]|nr:hypothetical protein [Oribacterium sp.]